MPFQPQLIKLHGCCTAAGALDQVTRHLLMLIWQLLHDLWLNLTIYCLSAPLLTASVTMAPTAKTVRSRMRHCNRGIKQYCISLLNFRVFNGGSNKGLASPRFTKTKAHTKAQKTTMLLPLHVPNVRVSWSAKMYLFWCLWNMPKCSQCTACFSMYR